jgi:DNA-binding beta-propeller fold protein YncE
MTNRRTFLALTGAALVASCGRSTESEMSPDTVAVRADGGELALLDVTSGRMAYAGTTALAISGVVPAPTTPGVSASLAYAPDGSRLFVGAGRTISTLDHGGAERARWSMPADVRGVAVSRDGRRVYCGAGNEVLWLEIDRGRVRGRAAVDGLLTLRSAR